MSTVKNFSATSSAVVDSASVNWNDHSGTKETISGTRQLLIGFTDDLTGEDRFRAIEAGSFSMFLYGGSGVALRVYELQGAFDEESVTFSRIPQSGYVSIGNLVPDGASGYNAYKSISVGARADLPLLFLKYGALLRPYANGGATVDTSRGSHPPQLALTLGDVCGLDSIQIRTSKQAYWQGPYQYYYGLPTNIYWRAQCTAPTAQAPRQASAVLRWRKAEGTTEHSVSIPSSRNSVDLPVGTFGGTNEYDPDETTETHFYLDASGSNYTVSQLGPNDSNRTIIVRCDANTTYTIKSGIPGTMRVASYPSVPALNAVSNNGQVAVSASDPTQLTITTNASAQYLVIQFFIAADASAGATLENALAGFSMIQDAWASAQVQVTITADSGVTTTSAWSTIYSAGVGWTVSCSPASGYVPKSAANTFRWSPVLSQGATGDAVQTAAVFRWRPSGGAATEIALTTGQSVTIPAGTFSTDTVEWQVETTVNGVRQTSDWMELSTVDALPTATPLSPSGTIVDGSAPIAFSWLHEITTGTAPSGADLQISRDGGDTWTALAHVSGPGTFYTAAAGALIAGDTLWRVRSYNSDGVAGAWSAGAQIVVVAAPAAPSVSSEDNPRPLISWQADGQQGYELRVDGALVSAEWGAASSYQTAEILADGTHVAEVRVQNVYGLWSEWGSAVFVVANAPGSAILVTAEPGEQITLRWTAAGYESFRVLRDGKLLASTQDFICVDDRAGAGAHVYQIVGLLSGGFYGLSAEVEAKVSLPCPMLLDVRGGAWLRLPAALQGQTAISDGWAPDVALVRYSGRGYPTAEIGAARSRTVTLRPAFPAAQREAAEALAGLVGKLLFYRDPRGAAFPAVITQLTGEALRQYFTFNLTLTEADGGVDDA